MIRLVGISKTFGTQKVVQDLHLEIKEGELVTLLGPSGCGKTTTLRIIAGFEMPDDGKIFIADKDMSAVPPWERNLGFVFQNYALFPHLRVRDNIGYGLRLRRLGRREISARVEEVAAILGIEGLLDRYPRQLSGGQQQRVAVARALAIRPRVLLMDEPLANLDAKLRDHVRFELRRLQRETGITTIYVTHDQAEAFALADRVALMEGGRLIQCASSEEIYRHPANSFAADFIGSSNIIRGKTIAGEGTDGRARIRLQDYIITAECDFQGFTPETEVQLIIRPEDMQIAPSVQEMQPNTIKARVRNITFLGSIYRLEADFHGQTLRVDIPSSRVPDVTEGADVWLSILRAVALAVE